MPLTLDTLPSTSTSLSARTHSLAGVCVVCVLCVREGERLCGVVHDMTLAHRFVSYRPSIEL